MALCGKVSLINKVLKAYGNSAGSVRNCGLHFDPKFRALRRKKMEAYRSKLYGKDEESKRDQMIRNGITPAPTSKDIPFYIGSTSVIMDPYVSPENEFKSSVKKMITKAADIPVVGSKNFMHKRHLLRYIPSFDEKSFPHDAKEIYINAHKCLMSMNLDNLEKYATERAFNVMLRHTENTTIRWDYLESLDPPKTVQIRVKALAEKNDLFAQVTVRFFSKQMLAIYDRFGRLMYGSEILAKDVLEYVVFERHLSNVYGSWKLHDKIIPDWLPKSDPIPKTYKQVPDTSEDEIIENEFIAQGLIEGAKVRDVVEEE